MQHDARELLAELPDAVVVLTQDGRVAEWSSGAQRMFGYPPALARGCDFADLVVPRGQGEAHRAALAGVMRGGTASFEALRRRADGSLLYVEVAARELPGPRMQPCWVLVERDVTHSKVRRDAQRLETRFRELLESMPDAIVVANLTGHIVIANSQAERLFGYDSGELRGGAVDALLPARLREAHVGHRSGYSAQPRKRAMGSGLDLAGLRRDGTEFPVEISLSPLQSDDGAFVMSAIRDISERKAIERTLQEANAQLASASAAKDRFLASMSHELRTPLNAIIGFTGTLLMRLPGPLTDDQERQLRTVQSAGRHLLALINDLLDVSKIEAGKVDLHIVEIDACALIDEVCATLRPQAVAKGLTLERECAGIDRPLRSDRRALHQILFNLAGNAVKFTHQGQVRITAEATAPADGGAGFRFVVEDTGIGLDADARERLFNAFSRIGRDVHAIEGTGLGLHLSQKLAGLLGGRITVDSTPGRGSRFALELPVV